MFLVRLDRDLQRQLARVVCGILGDSPGVDIVYRTGIYPARISELRHGKLARFSIGMLVNLIATFGFDIEISIRPTPPPKPSRRPPATSVVRYDRFGRVES